MAADNDVSDVVLLNDEATSAVITTLTRSPEYVCSICILRFAAAPPAHPLYRYSRDALDAVIARQFAVERSSSALCSVCLNTPMCGGAALVAALTSGGYNVQTFTVTVSAATTVALRNAVAIRRTRAHNVTEIKDVIKYRAATDIRAAYAAAQYASSKSDDALQCNITLSAANTPDELRIVGAADNRARSRQRKQQKRDAPELSQAELLKALPLLTVDKVDALYAAYVRAAEFAPVAAAESCVGVYRPPLLVAGYYCKYSRLLSQTPWSVGAMDDESDESALLAETSVETQIVTPLLPHYGEIQSHKFHASGREDVDVRMIGGGRPFIVEINDARIIPHDHLDDVAALINANSQRLVTVHSLRHATRADNDRLKNGIESKRKAYRAVACCKRTINQTDIDKLNAITNEQRRIDVMQETPIRVLHRRSLLTRAKTIYSLRAELINAHWLMIDLVASSGTYIKEFVHGDRGRTAPSIAHILNAQTDIIQLDVTRLVEDDSLSFDQDNVTAQSHGREHVA